MEVTKDEDGAAQVHFGAHETWTCRHCGVLIIDFTVLLRGGRMPASTSYFAPFEATHYISCSKNQTVNGLLGHRPLLPDFGDPEEVQAWLD